MARSRTWVPAPSAAEAILWENNDSLRPPRSGFRVDRHTTHGTAAGTGRPQTVYGSLRPYAHGERWAEAAVMARGAEVGQRRAGGAIRGGGGKRATDRKDRLCERHHPVRDSAAVGRSEEHT